VITRDDILRASGLCKSGKGIIVGSESALNIDKKYLNRALSIGVMNTVSSEVAVVYIKDTNFIILKDGAEVQDCENLFKFRDAVEKIDLLNIKIRNIVSMESMFDGCKQLRYIRFPSDMDTSNVTNMAYLFRHCDKLVTIENPIRDTHNVISMNYMYAHCHLLKYIDVSTYDTSKVRYMESMFYNCSRLKEIRGIKGIEVYNVENLREMFYGCRHLELLNLSNWVTSPNLKSVMGMFMNCSRLKALSLGNILCHNGINGYNMLNACEELKQLSVGNVGNIEAKSVFFACRNIQYIKVKSIGISENVIMQLFRVPRLTYNDVVCTVYRNINAPVSLKLIDVKYNVPASEVYRNDSKVLYYTVLDVKGNRANIKPQALYQAISQGKLRLCIELLDKK